VDRVGVGVRIGVGQNDKRTAVVECAAGRNEQEARIDVDPIRAVRDRLGESAVGPASGWGAEEDPTSRRSVRTAA
jgi:hypothetical protein